MSLAWSRDLPAAVQRGVKNVDIYKTLARTICRMAWSYLELLGATESYLDLELPHLGYQMLAPTSWLPYPGFQILATTY